MKKLLTIKGTFNDALTNYEDKEDSISYIVDDEEDCNCRGFRVCIIHRLPPGYTLTDLPNESNKIN